jgi:hypothetical protein
MRTRILLAAVALLGAASAPAFADLTADLGATVLVEDGAVRRPSIVRSPAVRGLRIGSLRLRFQGSKLVAVDVESGKVAWAVDVAVHPGRRLLAAADGVLYLPAGKPKGGPLRLRRIRLEDGGRLPPLLIADRAWTGEEIKAALPASDGRLFVLSGAEERGGLDRVRVFGIAGDERRFAVSLSVSADCLAPRAGLSAPGAEVRDGIAPLCLAGDELVVLPGAHEDLVGLSAESGEERWRREALWEYERSFIGPSVWKFFLSRAVRRDDSEGRDRMRKLRYLSAGPVAVPVPGRPGDVRVFVAVTRSPSEYSRRYLEDSDVLELAGGCPIALAHLPSCVGSARALDGGALFRAGSAALGLCRPSSGSGEMIVFGGSYAVARLAWWREIPYPTIRPPPWPGGTTTCESGRGISDPTVFAIDAGWTAAAPPFSLLAADVPDRLRIPVALLDLESGRERRIELRIPFGGEPGEPYPWWGRAVFADGSRSWVWRTTSEVRATAFEPGAHALSVFLEGPGGASAELVFP